MIQTTLIHHEFNRRLKELVSKSKIPHTKLRKALSHILLAKGKHLRPLLLLSITGDIGLDAASALEMVHTYSLIHDDLPCMDDAKVRRGKASLHIAFDEAFAVLSGDAFLTYAFEILANAPYESDEKVQLIQILTKRSGPRGMIEGQCLDITAKETPINWSEYQTLAMRKTADLFSASLEMGAVLRKCKKKDQDILSSLGHSIGLIYQILDDLDDEDASAITKIYEKKKIFQIVNLLNQNALRMYNQLSFTAPFLEEFLYSLTKKALI